MLKHKNKIKRETLALHEHIEYFSVTVGVGSPDVSRNSRPSKVTIDAGSPDAQSLSLRGDRGRRKSRRESEVPTQAGSPSISGSAGQLSAHVGTPDVRRKF